MNPLFEQQNEFVIARIETLKVMADSLRMQLMDLLKTPQTVKDLATELEMPASKLYYHINQLESHGLIKVVQTNIVSGIIEKTYQTTAREFRLSDQLLTPANMTDHSVEDLLEIIFDQTKKDVRRSIQAGLVTIPHPAGAVDNRLLGRTMVMMPPERYLEFVHRFEGLMQEFVHAGTPPSPTTQTDAGNTPLHSYNLTIALYPMHIKHLRR